MSIKKIRGNPTLFKQVKFSVKLSGPHRSFLTSRGESQSLIHQQHESDQQLVVSLLFSAIPCMLRSVQVIVFVNLMKEL